MRLAGEDLAQAVRQKPVVADIDEARCFQIANILGAAGDMAGEVPLNDLRVMLDNTFGEAMRPTIPLRSLSQSPSLVLILTLP